MVAVATLERTTFRTSRLLEFCSPKELTAQTGHEPDDWPLVILKELVDNALDACEEAGITPAIGVTGRAWQDPVRDNGPGMPPTTVDRHPRLLEPRLQPRGVRRRRTAAPRATRSRRSSPCRSP